MEEDEIFIEDIDIIIIFNPVDYEASTHELSDKFTVY